MFRICETGARRCDDGYKMMQCNVGQGCMSRYRRSREKSMSKLNCVYFNHGSRGDDVKSPVEETGVGIGEGIRAITRESSSSSSENTN